MENVGSEIRCGPFRIDLKGESLWQRDSQIHLRPKTFAVLRYLAMRPGVLVTKGQLLDAVWADVSVDEETLTKSISELRTAFSDDPRRPLVIETVHRRGYRFLPRTGTHGGAYATTAGEPGSTLAPPALPTLDVPNVVGRNGELAQLERLFASARSGERRLAFITGDAGIGKTSLMGAFLSSLAHSPSGPCWVLRGQCLESYGVSEPYLPLLSAFEELLGEATSDELIALARRTAPTWLAQVPWVAAKAEPAPERGYATEQHMPREFCALLESLADVAPVILVLDDLHWSDAPTMDVLALLAQQQRPCRLLVLAAYRPAEAVVREHPVRRLHRDLRLRRRGEQIALGFLDEDSIHTFLGGRLGKGFYRQSLARLLHRQTDGHPLFMTALLDHLIEQRWLVRGHEGWKLVVSSDEVMATVPSDVRQLIEMQLESMSPQAQTVLRAASLAGLEFDSRAVAGAVGVSTAEIERVCEASERIHQFLIRVAESQWPDQSLGARYRFRHGLYQKVLQDQVAPASRQELHQRLGERIESGFGTEAGSVCAELAGHFIASGDGPRACRYLAMWGERALGRFAYREAFGCFEKALALVATTSDPAAVELRLRRLHSVTLSAIHGYASAELRTNLERANELSEKIGDVTSTLEVLYALSFLHFARADHDATWSTVRRLSELAPGAGPMAQLQSLLALGSAAVWSGDQATAGSAFRELWDLHRRGPASSEILAGYGVAPIVAAGSNYSYHLWLTGRGEEARNQSEQALAKARELENPFTLAGALTHASVLALMNHTPEAANRFACEAFALAAEHGLEFWRNVAGLVRGCMGLGQARDVSRAIQRTRALITKLDRAGTRIFLATAHGLLAGALLDVGRATDGLATVDAGLALAKTSLDRMYEAELWRLKGDLLLVAKASTDAAGECFENALRVAREQGALALELRAACSKYRFTHNGEPDLRRAVSAFPSGATSGELREASELLDIRSALPARRRADCM